MMIINTKNEKWAGDFGNALSAHTSQWMVQGEGIMYQTM